MQEITMQQCSKSNTSIRIHAYQKGTKRVRNDRGAPPVDAIERNLTTRSIQHDFHHQGQEQSTTTQEKLNEEKSICFRRKMKRRCSKVGRMFFASSLDLMGAEIAIDSKK